MATFVKFHAFSEAVAEKKHDLGADTFYFQFLATSPNASTHAVETDLPADLSTGGGYTQGGMTLGTATYSAQTGGVYVLKIADKVFTATGAVGPFRYVAIFNFTSAAKNLIGYADYGTDLTLQNNETFTIDFSETNGAITLT